MAEPDPSKILVKDTEAGKAIGHGGETVRGIMEKTGTDIEVQKSKEVPKGCPTREITIFGSREQQDEATKMLLKELSWAKKVDGEMLKGDANDAPELKEEKAEEDKRQQK